MVYILGLILILLILIVYEKYYRKKSMCKLLSDSYYFNKFNEKDYVIRNITKNNGKDVYCSNYSYLNLYEKNKIKNIINKIEKSTNIANFFAGYKIIKINKKIELGLPHTRNDVILLPNHIFNDLDNFRSIGNLLIHEQTHIHQKRIPSVFNDLYINYWNFKKANNIIGKDRFLNNVRTNPDGLDTLWVFNKNGKYIWLLSLYKKNLSFFDVNYVGIYLENKNNGVYSIPKNPTISNILDIDVFTNFFVDVQHNIYHPNEICAEVFSQYYFNLMEKNNIDVSKPYLRMFLKWYERNMDKIINLK